MKAVLNIIKNSGRKLKITSNDFFKKIIPKDSEAKRKYSQFLKDKEIICCYDYKNKRVLRSNSEFEKSAKILKDLSLQIIDKFSKALNSSQFSELEIVEWKKSIEYVKLLLVKFEETGINAHLDGINKENQIQLFPSINKSAITLVNEVIFKVLNDILNLYETRAVNNNFNPDKLILLNIKVKALLKYLYNASKSSPNDLFYLNEDHKDWKLFNEIIQIIQDEKGKFTKACVNLEHRFIQYNAHFLKQQDLEKITLKDILRLSIQYIKNPEYIKTLAEKNISTATLKEFTNIIQSLDSERTKNILFKSIPNIKYF